jgi:type II secretion system protein I
MKTFRRKTQGFSLLEVILALGILVGAMAVLGELARIAMRNAAMARDYSRAELLCESKLGEIIAGITQPVAVQPTPCETQPDLAGPQWLYQIDVSSLDTQGLLAVQVTVTQDLPPPQRPVAVSLTRWVPDPNAASSQTSPEDTSSSSTSGSGM